MGVVCSARSSVSKVLAGSGQKVAVVAAGRIAVGKDLFEFAHPRSSQYSNGDTFAPAACGPCFTRAYLTEAGIVRL
jgi:hypothetical protein